MTQSTRTRRVRWVGGAFLALAFLAALLVAGRGWRLRAEHDFVSWVRQRAIPITLDVGAAGEIRMFLNPADKTITVGSGDTVIDIGANVGYYTLIAARLVGEEGRVFAFEPDPVSFPLLERNVALNGFRNVVLEQKAVSNAPGTLKLFIAEDNKGDHWIYQPDGEEREYVEVESVVLDDYFADDLAGVDFVKIDTQGAEVVVLEGMQRILREAPDLRLAVEYWPLGLADFGSTAERLLEILAAANLRIFNLAGPPGGPLREVTAERLQTLYLSDRRGFTNLLGVKDGAGLELLRRHGATLLPSSPSTKQPGRAPPSPATRFPGGVQ